MGENKDKANERATKGTPNPWIYDVLKAFPADSIVSASADDLSEPVVSASPSISVENEVTFNRLTSFPQPTLPDVAPLMTAIATLDGQVASLQEQFNTTQKAIHNHEADIAQAVNQLHDGIRQVREQMDKVISDVAPSSEELSLAELIQLMEDMVNNPRDIEYLIKLTRKARELNKFFQIHQNVLNTMAECNCLLREMIGEGNA